MEVVSIVLIVLCVLNVSVSFSLFRRNDLEIIQKISQSVIVWLIPFLGAIGLYFFHKSQDNEIRKPFKGEFGGGDNGSSHTNSGD